MKGRPGYRRCRSFGSTQIDVHLYHNDSDHQMVLLTPVSKKEYAVLFVLVLLTLGYLEKNTLAIKASK